MEVSASLIKKASKAEFNNLNLPESVSICFAEACVAAPNSPNLPEYSSSLSMLLISTVACATAVLPNTSVISFNDNCSPFKDVKVSFKLSPDSPTSSKILRRPVPIRDAWKPLSARTPIAAAVSWNVIPNCPAIGAT